MGGKEDDPQITQIDADYVETKIKFYRKTPYLHEKSGFICFPAPLNLDAQPSGARWTNAEPLCEARARCAALLDGDLHELADAALIERGERGLLEDFVLVVGVQEVAHVVA
jgi:hypothetical protein